MIKFLKISKKGSKYFYNFECLGISGILSIDENTNAINIVSSDGLLKNNEKSKKELLYIASKLIDEKFPQSFLYAYC